MGSPIRKSSDQSLFAAPRRLSQRITSFIACHCQGIHQMLLLYLIHLSCLSYRTKKLYTIRIKTIPCYLFASTQNYYVCCVTVQTTHTIMFGQENMLSSLFYHQQLAFPFRCVPSSWEACYIHNHHSRQQLFLFFLHFFHK
ncbi:MAG: hypothetical protein EAZ66_07005 [Alphaproteobacteria bacterium]|nr:MAG: hypothetical protein EAZ66_07005 [Alphaproteobacteria bacterium]